MKSRNRFALFLMTVSLLMLGLASLSAAPFRYSSFAPGDGLTTNRAIHIISAVGAPRGGEIARTFGLV